MEKVTELSVTHANFFSHKVLINESPDKSNIR